VTYPARLGACKVTTPKQNASEIVAQFVDQHDMVAFVQELISCGSAYGLMSQGKQLDKSARRMFEEAVEDELRKVNMATCRCQSTRLNRRK
jgi:hypothetical protein